MHFWLGVNIWLYIWYTARRLAKVRFMLFFRHIRIFVRNVSRAWHRNWFVAKPKVTEKRESSRRPWVFQMKCRLTLEHSWLSLDAKLFSLRSAPPHGLIY